MLCQKIFKGLLLQEFVKKLGGGCSQGTNPMIRGNQKSTSFKKIKIKIYLVLEGKHKTLLILSVSKFGPAKEQEQLLRMLFCSCWW